MSETQYKNIPYVAQYDENGKKIELVNGIYNPFPNRKARRSEGKDARFRGNKKGVSLTVFNNGKGSAKYHRVVQQVLNKKTGEVRFINHYKQA